MKKWTTIKNEAEYSEACLRMEEIYQAESGSEDYQEMLLLSTLINEYEKIHYSFPSE